ncbi:exoglucanase B precursor [Methanobrevibacter cuticularis]|uniref:Exoglucanase B n=1 Tax=Methanobrevibacter cuticularis TaxID=47311 RepID=A0A166CRA9_9EURY|nr:CAP domain-containing protein [Methanobrevibacter cuticularis]KZX14783.1 exoglucanase B precursor [Methanobrevibacter cuticularis]
MGIKNKFLGIAILMSLLLIIGSISVISSDFSYATSNSDFSNEVIRLVNIERAKLGLDPLELNVNLQGPADIRVSEIIRNFSHTRPDGSSWETVSPEVYGENLARGQTTPKEVVDDWMASPGHRKNILDPEFNSIAVSCTNVLSENGSQSTQVFYWVQLFGVSASDKIYMPEPIFTFKGSSISSNSIVLKWQKSSDYITGYKIYRYDEKIRGYNLLKTITKNTILSFTDKKLSSATSYKYKIIAYKTLNNKVYNSNSSQILKVTTKPLKTSLSLSPSKKKILLRWKKIPRVSGYQIYRHTSKNGKYKLLKNIKKASIVKYTNTNLIKNKKYFYKVRSYKIVDDKKIYSDFSVIKYNKPR